ncbi:MAG: hypothetical protein J6O61_00990 [Butyrivibrio sp.]|uniref:asparagine synthase-related protein n=1 Tax=Butyrivibrio sp. TaxID=28121 RepID=UPI001B0D2FE8|nr:asparagine synthase-related protein [Butyrivibrio sp.]MBO6239437.1 hypothetical protein [Butyrivibrio sp.]
MSSIYGIFVNSFNQINIEEKSLSALSKWNRAYGDYLDGRILEYPVGMGSFIDRLNDDIPKSKAILKNERKKAVIDAVIYNRDELICKCDTKSNIPDEELLFAYICRYGFKALREVNGDFCGAIYNEDSNDLVLFRDHMGVRPLYYYFDDDFVCFSTDLRGLIATGKVDTAVNEDWLYETIHGKYAYNQKNTEFQNILCITPGSFCNFKFDKNKVSFNENVYWKPGQKKIRLKSDAHYQKRLRELIEDSVKIRLDAVSGLVGAEMSGGLDSGVIDILIKRFGRECIYFSWSKSPDELKMVDKDERLVIQDICKQENIKCNYTNANENYENIKAMSANLKKSGFVLNEDERAAFRYVLPPSIMTMPVCSSAESVTSHGAKVIFTGHGGDEGVSHRSKPYEMFHNHEYYHYFRYMYSTTHLKKHRIINTLKICKLNLIDGRKILFTPQKGLVNDSNIINKDFALKYANYEMPLSYFSFDPIMYILNGGSRSRLDNVALLGAYCNVRYMVPYLDYRVIDYAVSIPRYQYLRGHFNRYIFREAFKDIMPHSLYVLKDKMENSDLSVPKAPDWFMTFSDGMKDIIKRLDRDYWSKYINYDLIDDWMKRSELESEYKPEDESLLYVLFMCAEFQNVIEKTYGTLY